MSKEFTWHNEVAPTHRCKICGALWRYWPYRDTGHKDSWNLRSATCGKCCDTAPMGDQIEPINLDEMLKYILAREAIDLMKESMNASKD